MSDLVKLLMEKANVSEETAKLAIQVVANFTKEKLPDPIGGIVQNFLQTGETPDMSSLASLAGNLGGAGNLLGGLGSMFGKK
ncbi:MAG: hypothetical protein NZM06_10275 [Chloroherpetonaceae bacterium]|nr:hypothetical protein [Chloroherpetonaceae bacterium]MDW8438689.1 hypothetical protein [Chloroherpetonaceae bacterium]